MAGFLNIGHRGACAYTAENTIASLREAVERHADMLEFDVRQTADGVCVLFHDWTIKTASGTRKLVSRTTFSELSESIAQQGHSIGTLEDVLKLFGPVVSLNIQIKAGGFESDVIRLLKKHPPYTLLSYRHSSPGLWLALENWTALKKPALSWARKNCPP